MDVSLPAQRPEMHAHGRGCTCMYETRNETAQIDPRPLGRILAGTRVMGEEHEPHLTAPE
jgi:hypothetical protein